MSPNWMPYGSNANMPQGLLTMIAAAEENQDLWTELQFRTLACRNLHRIPPSSPSHGSAGMEILQSRFAKRKTSNLRNEILGSLRPAAVLIPVVRREKLTVLLTRRAAHLKYHAAEIAFPGGKIEKSDADPMMAALREAEEEIGLHGSFVEPMGYLDGYLTGTGFHVVPLVAIIEPAFSLTLDPSEVDDAFEVPLSFLMDSAHHKIQMREWQGRRVSYYTIAYGEHFIWGATAGMIRNMHERFTQE